MLLVIHKIPHSREVTATVDINEYFEWIAERGRSAYHCIPLGGMQRNGLWLKW
jgi:hypothetical protein